MTEPLIESPRASANGTTVQTTKPRINREPTYADYENDAPPGTPRWVKGLGIALVVLLLAFAGLHLTGMAPTHMPGGSSVEHGMQAP